MEKRIRGFAFVAVEFVEEGLHPPSPARALVGRAGTMNHGASSPVRRSLPPAPGASSANSRSALLSSSQRGFSISPASNFELAFDRAHLFLRRRRHRAVRCPTRCSSACAGGGAGTTRRARRHRPRPRSGRDVGDHEAAGGPTLTTPRFGYSVVKDVRHFRRAADTARIRSNLARVRETRAGPRRPAASVPAAGSGSRLACPAWTGAGG